MSNLLKGELKIFVFLISFLRLCCLTTFAQDSELSNLKSGISVIWQGEKGMDYQEEYLYHDKNNWDAKVVYIRDTTLIEMKHNAKNLAWYHSSYGGRQTIGVNGKDGIPDSGDEGVIRYKIDYERNWQKRWAALWNNDNSPVYPSYSAPFSLSSQVYDDGNSVVGTTGGSKPIATAAGYYDRGSLDKFGDEWHVIAYADDMRSTFKKLPNLSENWVDDGKSVLVVVNPKTPALTVRAFGNAQFYTTPPKAYFSPVISEQTTFISPRSGSISIEIGNLYSNKVFYKIDTCICSGFQFFNTNRVFVSDSQFVDGTNVLSYFYQGNESIIKTRIIVKNPTFPSASEPHGHFLFGDASNRSNILSRIKREPYLSIYKGYRDNRDVAGHQFADSGIKSPGSRPTANNGYANTLGNAIVANIEGWNFKVKNSTNMSSGEYAKYMMLYNTRTLDPLGFELSHSSDAIPSKELHYRGYYDADPVQETLFAYDIFAANFRSDQVNGGMTEIEDYFIRDRLASFAYEAMLWSAGMNLMGSPGMWGGARMMTGAEIALVLKDYSTPYYGTSGFGAEQRTFALCPFMDDKYTWKQALFNTDTPKKGFLNYKWGTGISGTTYDTALIPTNSYFFGGNWWPAFTWGVKSSYFSHTLMGKHLSIWANVFKRNWNNHSDAGFEELALRASNGTMQSAGDGFPPPYSRYTQLMLCNDLWPTIRSNTITYSAPRPPTDYNSIKNSFQNFYGIFWYDDSPF